MAPRPLMQEKRKWFMQDGKLVYHKQSDPNPVLESTAALRSAGKTTMGKENWHVGCIPMHVLEKWIKEAGLRLDDREAVADLIRRKLLDGDNAFLRVHEGTW